MPGSAQEDPDAIRSGMGAVTLVCGCSTLPSQMNPYPQGKNAFLPDPPGHRNRFGHEVRLQQQAGIIILVQQVLLGSADYIIDVLCYPFSYFLIDFPPPFLHPPSLSLP